MGNVGLKVQLKETNVLVIDVGRSTGIRTRRMAYRTIECLQLNIFVVRASTPIKADFLKYLMNKIYSDITKPKMLWKKLFRQTSLIMKSQIGTKRGGYTNGDTRLIGKCSISVNCSDWS